MKLIVGGAYQGKLDYAIQNYSITESEIYNCQKDSIFIDFTKKVINDFHLFVFAQLCENINTLDYIKNNIKNFEDKIIICEDISCGVVPVEPKMRKWRESVGHCAAFISKNSDEVIRVFCGLGTKLK